MKRVLVMVLLAVASITAASEQARAQMDDNPMVGAAAMFKSKERIATDEHGKHGSERIILIRVSSV